MHGWSYEGKCICSDGKGNVECTECVNSVNEGVEGLLESSG